MSIDDRLTFLGLTSDGVPVYWGKKNSNDPDSRDLSLWVALGDYDPSGDNYRRVPAEWEVLYFDHIDRLSKHGAPLKGTDARWEGYVGVTMGTLSSEEILGTWYKPGDDL